MKEKINEILDEVSKGILAGEYIQCEDEQGRKVVKIDGIAIHVQNDNLMFIPFKLNHQIDWYSEINKRERLKFLEEQERSIKEEISELKKSLRKEKKEQVEPKKKVKKQSKKQKKDE